MGGFISRLFDSLGKKEYRILMLGLDGAGKTTTLYNMKLGEVVHTMPTVGFNLETVTYRGVSFNTWDVGGQDKIRRLWRYYFQGTHAVVFVVDSSDTKRVDEAAEELSKLMAEDELTNCKLLVYANKQDLPQAMTTSKLAENLGLHKLRGHEWFIQGCCATTGDGLHEGLDWLVDTLKRS